jgi:hypothetical protein
VCPLIALAYPAPKQVPRLVRAAPPRLVPAAWLLSLAEHTSSRSSKLGQGAKLNEVSESQQPIVTGCHHSTRRGGPRARGGLVDTGRHAVRAFGTKRPQLVQFTVRSPRCSRAPLSAGHGDRSGTASWETAGTYCKTTEPSVSDCHRASSRPSS